MLTIEDHIKITDKEISRIEEYFGYRIPKNILDFIEKYNGWLKRDNEDELDFDYTHDDGWEDGNTLQKVLNLKDIIESTKYLSFLNDFKDHFELKDSYVEVKYLMPIIDMEGSCIYISTNGKHLGTLYVVDNGDFGVIKLEVSLKEIEMQIHPEPENRPNFKAPSSLMKSGH